MQSPSQSGLQSKSADEDQASDYREEDKSSASVFPSGICVGKPTVG